MLLNYIIVACQHIVEKNEINLSEQYEYTRFYGFSTEVLPLIVGSKLGIF